MFTFIFEVEERCELAAFMIAAKHEERFGIQYFVRVQVENNLRGETSSINVVTEEQVLSVLGVTTDLEEADEVEELAMHVTAYCDGIPDLQDVSLVPEHLGGGGN